MMTTLRPYQAEAVAHVLAARVRGERSGLVALPTGSGKTTVAAEVIHRLPGRALVVAHTALLGEQLRNAITDHLDEPVGLVAEGNARYGDARAVVALRQSLTAANLDALMAFGPFATLAIDEAHHASADSTYATIRDALRSQNPDLFTLGLTATPWREHGALLFERYWFSREIADMIPLGVLAPVRHARVALPLDLRHTRVKGGDYATQTIAPKLLRIVDETAARVAPLLHERTHIVAFAVTIGHAQALAAAFERAGVSATHVSGDMKNSTRDDAIARWRSGALRVLVNVGIVTEGFDEPRISAIVFARPTASTLFYVQALGRGLRIAPKKDDVLVIDCVGLGELSDVRQVTLDAIVPEVASLGTVAPVEPEEYKGRRLVCGPNDDASHVWKTLAPQVYGLDVGRREWIILRRDGASGLYDATRIDDRGRHLEALGDGPFALIVERVRERLRNTKGVFCARRARWRKEPATLQQLEMLARFDPPLAIQARAERWKRGRVSDSIATTCGRRVAARAGLLPGVTPQRWVS